MIRKMILIVFALLLAVSACVPAERVTEDLVSSTGAPTEDTGDPTPTPEVPITDSTDLDTESTPYPEPDVYDANPEPDVNGTYPEPDVYDPYPEPEEPTSANIVDPYPGPGDEEWPLILIDDLGNTIELKNYPQAIVSISPSMTEILFAIGAGDQLIGRDDQSLYPEAVLDVESIGSLWEGMPTETILALEPDLVFAAEIISEENVQVLLDLGLQVYWQANPTDFDSLYENLLELGEITGHTEETENLVVDLKNRVRAVLENVADAEDIPLVFYELDATDPSNPWTTGSGTFIDYIITLAGGKNAASALQGEYAQISAEELIAVNPEIILLSDALYGVTPESVAERPGWNVMSAVQTGEIHPIDPNIMSVPGPRLVDALEETAKLLHPELFD